MKHYTFTKKMVCIVACLFLMGASLFAQTLTSDHSDYAPGSIATLTGSGFQSGETVTLQVVHADGSGDNSEPTHQPWDVTAHGDGGFVATWEVNGDGDQIGALLLATADGQSSGYHAEATFTDDLIPGTGVVTISAVGQNSCLAYTPGGGKDTYEVVEGGSYVITITGVTECSQPSIKVLVISNDNGNWCFNIPSVGGGTYSGEFTMNSPTCNTSRITYKCDTNSSCTSIQNETVYAALGSNGNPAQFRSNTWTNCSNPVLDTQCDNNGCPPPYAAITTNGSTDLCQGGCVLLGGHGGVSYLWNTGSTAKTIYVCSSGVYIVTVTNSCGSTSTASITVTVSNPPTFNNLPQGGNLGCTATPPTCNNNVTATNSCGTVTATCTAGSITTNGCTLTQTFHYHAIGACCGNADADVTYTWSATNSVSLSVPNPLPSCGLAGNHLTATVSGSGTVSNTTGYYWTVSGTGWSITAGQGTPTITYTSGNSGTQGTFSVTVTNNCGCTSTAATVTFGTSCQTACGYTQGFYGGTGKDCNQNQALTVINSALANGGGFTLGTSGHSISFGTGDGNCIKSHMPAGTTPAQLPAYNKNCSTATGNSYLNNNKYISVLVGQLIALWLNTHISGTQFGSLSVNGPYLTFYKSSSCTNGKPTSTKKVIGPLPSSVMTYMTNNYGSSFTINQLWTAANNALGNGSSNPSLSDWTTAADILNNIQGCYIYVGSGNSSQGLRLENEETNFTVGNSISDLNIYPNPTSGQLTLSFIAPAGTTSIDVYNISGVLVYHSETTEQDGGIAKQQIVDATNWTDGVYFARLSSANNSVVGKVIVAK